MSRLKDLEDSIRQSYELIREYDEKVRLADDPRERARAERDSAQQWSPQDQRYYPVLPLEQLGRTAS